MNSAKLRSYWTRLIECQSSKFDRPTSDRDSNRMYQKLFVWHNLNLDWSSFDHD